MLVSYVQQGDSKLVVLIYLFFSDLLISGSASPPTLFFVFKVVLAVPGPLLANFYKIEIVVWKKLF